MRLRTSASLLGILAALALGLSGCGSQSTIKGALSQSSNTRLSNELSAVSDAVNGTSCGRARTALASLDSSISGLPSATNAKLVGNLRQGAAMLRALALKECHGARPTTTSSSSSATTTSSSSSPTTTSSTSTTGTTTTHTQTQTQTQTRSNTNTLPGTGSVTSLGSGSTTQTNGGGGLGQ